jgi:hypothetical protein
MIGSIESIIAAAFKQNDLSKRDGKYTAKANLGRVKANLGETIFQH